MFLATFWLQFLLSKVKFVLKHMKSKALIPDSLVEISGARSARPVASGFRVWSCLLASALLALAGCGDDEKDPESDALSDADATSELGDTEPGDTSDASETDTEEPFDPAAYGDAGPWSIGYTDRTVTYTDPVTDLERTLRVAVWYPATERSAERPLYLGIGANVSKDPPVADLTGVPVFVFSHGHGGFAESSAYIMEHFASHGWMVISPTHTGDTTGDVDTERENSIYYQRPLDLTTTLDFFQNLDASDPLATLGGDQILLGGHSFGGYSTFSISGAIYAIDELVTECAAGTGPGNFCMNLLPAAVELFRAGFRDERFLASIALDSGDYDLFRDGLDDIDHPMLNMTANRPGDQLATTLTGPDQHWVNLPRGCHNIYALLGCGAGEIDKAEGNRIARIYTFGFANRYILGDERASVLFDGSLEISEEAVLVP